MEIKGTKMRNYTRPLTGWLDDDVYTVSEWCNDIRGQMCTPMDGVGLWVKDGLKSDDENVWDEPQDATHVVWYNK